jgi:two-component system phosphate regulon sensor histidine kinase PhoR
MRNAAAAALTARGETTDLADIEGDALRDAEADASDALEATPATRALRGEPMREARLLVRDSLGRDRVMLASSNSVRGPTGVALGAVTMFHDITEQERRARLYKRLFSRMGASLDPAVEMQALADTLVEEGGFAAAAIYVTAPDAQGLDLLAACNYPDVVLPLARHIARDAETLSAGALRTGQPQIIARWRDAGALENLAQARRIAEMTHTGGVAELPLLARGKVAGVLLVKVAEPAALTADDMALVQELAGRAALALDNAQLYQSAQATAAQQDAIINAIAEGVWVCDPSGQLTLVNAAAHDLFGLPPGDAPRSLDDFSRHIQPRWLDGRPMAPEDSPLSRGLRGDVSTEFEAIMRQAGTERDLTLQLSYAPIRDDAGAITGAVSVGRDVTDLHELQRSRQEFLTVASHEMKTPLTTLLGFLQVIRRHHAKMMRAHATNDLAPPESDLSRAAAAEAEEAWRRKEGDLLLRIETQARRLDRLVSDLLDDARIQQGQLEYRWGEGDVAGAVAEAVDEQRTSHPERQIDLRVADVPLVAQLDADRIGQVVTNLLTNALKYSRAEDPVEVTVASQRHAESGQVEAVVRVRDRGPGIPTEHVAQVFERYYRVPGVEVRSGSGIGLGVGLHLACSIVERHGGRIWVDEAASPGATFAFTIPLLDPPPPAP